MATFARDQAQGASETFAAEAALDAWMAGRDRGREATRAELEALVKDLSLPVDFGLDTMNEFIDWNRSVPFEVIRGEGECAV